MPVRYVIEGRLLLGDWDAPSQPFGIVFGEDRAEVIVRELNRYFDGEFFIRELEKVEAPIILEHIRQALFQQSGAVAFSIAAKIVELAERMPLELAEAPEQSEATKAQAADLENLSRPVGEWSPPMSKAEIARRITRNNRARFRDVEQMFPEGTLKPLSDRKWAVRLDTLDNNSRRNLETPI